MVHYCYSTVYCKFSVLKKLSVLKKINVSFPFAKKSDKHFCLPLVGMI